MLWQRLQHPLNPQTLRTPMLLQLLLQSLSLQMRDDARAALPEVSVHPVAAAACASREGQAKGVCPYTSIMSLASPAVAMGRRSARARAWKGTNNRGGKGFVHRQQQPQSLPQCLPGRPTWHRRMRDSSWRVATRSPCCCCCCCCCRSVIKYVFSTAAASGDSMGWTCSRA